MKVTVRNRMEDLADREIFILSLSLSLSGYARQDTKYHLTINQLAGFFFLDYPVFSYETHSINPIPPPLPLRQRTEDCVLSGGMRYMEMPCPYAARMSFM